MTKIGKSVLKSEFVQGLSESEFNVEEDKVAESEFNVKEDKVAESEFNVKEDKGRLVRSKIHRVLSDGEETIREIRRMMKTKKGNAQSNTRELIRENKELRDQIRNLTGKVTQPGLGQDHVASIPRSLLENGINSNGCAKERNQTDQNHHVERHSYSRERRGPHKEEACHGNEELRNFDGNTRK
ncbi:hypothetical protein LWI29_029715 [Acer saccharum]|uniref:Uncharacterized protein n=1 Tax=Acer saccharum TaxID=4024 RepID=A0AA39VLR4_ACESA|nr:hypothetical protein LWI29_029715 [Acer saccharum]